jgi:hypothetical protein
MSADTIVNMAKLAWDVIKDGKPAVDISNSTANAVPQVDDWQTLTDTQSRPNVRRIYYHNSFMWPLDDYDHVQFEILLKWDYGARYQGGGAFIPNIWIEVPQCFAGWPWDVNISLTAHHPTNTGGSGAPHARIPVTISGTVSSGAEHHTVQWGYVLFGNGSVEVG